MVDKEVDVKLTAVFLMVLTILIPIHMTVSVNASSWDNTFGNYGGNNQGQYVAIRTLYGQDQISGFRRTYDSVTIKAQGSLGNNVTVQPSNMEVFFSGYAMGQFQSCQLVSAQNSVYECTFTEGNDTGAAAANVQTYDVNLINGSELVATTSTTLVVDGKEPSIISFDRSTTSTADPNVTVTFDIKDYAYTGATGVGLRKVTVSANGNTQYSFPEGNSSATICTDTAVRTTRLQKTVNLSLGSTTGSYPVTIYAEDCFGQYISDDKKIRVDVDAPTILTTTFDVDDSSGNDAEWLSDDSETLTVYLEFRASDIKTSSIYGDFSDVNVDGSNSNVRPTCSSLANHTYGCTFTTTAKINATRSYSFYFYVEDNLGNYADANLGYNLKYDNSGPAPTSFTTTKYYNGNYYIGESKTNFTINIRENGIGVNDTKVYLGLQDLGLGSSVQADNCTPSWVCYWYDMTATSSSASSLDWMTTTVTVNNTNYTYQLKAKLGEVKFLSSSEDDLGNYANQTIFNISVDVYDPEINDYNISTISSSSLYDNLTVVGDYINIWFNVTDGSFVKMNVSADDFIDDYSQEITCTDKNDGTHICEHRIGPIENEGYYHGQIDIRIFDFLDNEITYTEYIDVLEIENGSTSYWSIQNLGCSPNPIDRELVNRMNTEVYCQVALSSGSADIYDLSAGSCTATAVGQYADSVTGSVVSSSTSTGNISLASYNWMGIPADQPTLYVNFVTSPFSAQVDEIECVCQVNVRSVAADGTKVTQNFEGVNVTFTIEMYNDPLGEVNQSVWDSATDIYDTYVDDGAWETIGYLKSFVDLSKKLCSLGQTIQNILRAIDTILAIENFWTDGLSTNAVTKPTSISMGINTAMQDYARDGLEAGFKELWAGLLGKYCAFISCKLVYSEGWGIISDMQRWVETYTQWIATMGIWDTIINDEDESVSDWWDNTGSTPFTSNSDDAIQPRYTNNYKDGRDEPTDTVPPAGGRDDREDALGDDYAFTELSYGIDPYENYIVAVASLCLPAIIYNLEKWRQIQCTYGSCLLTSGRTSIPLTLCEGNKDYAQCKYIYGPIFQLIPFVDFISDMQQIIANIFADPLLLVDTSLNILCKTKIGAKLITCTGAPGGCSVAGWALWTCWLYDTWDLYQDIAEDLEDLSESDYWDATDLESETGSCATFKDSYETLDSGDTNSS